MSLNNPGAVSVVHTLRNHTTFLCHAFVSLRPSHAERLATVSLSSLGTFVLVHYSFIVINRTKSDNIYNYERTVTAPLRSPRAASRPPRSFVSSVRVYHTAKKIMRHHLVNLYFVWYGNGKVQDGRPRTAWPSRQQKGQGKVQ